MRKIILVTPPKQLNNDLHLKLLYKILEQNGFIVLPFSLTLVFKYRKKAIWHIHWIDQFHRGTFSKIGIYKPIPAISLLRMLNFLILLLSVKLIGAKIIWSVHNVYSHEYGGTQFEKIVTLFLLHCSYRVTAHNEYTRKFIRRKYGFKNVWLMRQGIYEGCYQHAIPKVQAREKLGIMESKFVLLMFGGLLPYKGVDVLLEAAMEYNDNDLLIILAGRTDKNPKFGRLIKEMVKKDNRFMLFDKFIPEDEVPYFFGAADYTIYPYRQISNSGVLFLSITFGVPSIISDIGGVQEVTSLVPKANILIKEPTIELIISAIKEAKERPDVSQEMRKLQNLLSWNHLEKEIYEVFQFQN